MMTKLLTRLLGTLTWKIALDAIEAVMGRIKWGIILERFLTRLVVTALDWLAAKSTNTLTQETVADFKNQLLANGLRKADD